MQLIVDIERDDVASTYPSQLAGDLLEQAPNETVSALLVPVKAAGRVLGVMSLVSDAWAGSPGLQVLRAADGLAGAPAWRWRSRAGSKKSTRPPWRSPGPSCPTRQLDPRLRHGQSLSAGRGRGCRRLVRHHPHRARPLPGRGRRRRRARARGGLFDGRAAKCRPGARYRGQWSCRDPPGPRLAGLRDSAGRLCDCGLCGRRPRRRGLDLGFGRALAADLVRWPWREDARWPRGDPLGLQRDASRWTNGYL